MHNLFDLTGKTALITGGTHGLGFSMAAALAEAGASIIINGHSGDHMKMAVARFNNAGIQTRGYLFDISDEEQVKNGIHEIEQNNEKIDILINNAAISKRSLLNEISLVDFEKIIRVNLTGAFIVAKHVVPGMMSRKSGKIINICSMMTELARETTGAYAAAKGGLKMLTRSMAVEWAPYNIQVNGIGPGYMETHLTAPLSDPSHPMSEFIRKRTPAGRWGKPEDLKGAAIFLSSSASDFITGHILYVDGGIMASLGRP